MPLSHPEFQINPQQVLNHQQTDPIANDLKALHDSSSDQSTAQEPTAPLQLTEETKQSVAQFESIKQQLSSS